MVDTSESTISFVTLCLATRILMSLGCTGLDNAAFVLLSEHFHGNIATALCGIGEVFTGIGLAPALGGFLYEAGGYILPFAVIGGCSLGAIPFAWYLLPENHGHNTIDKRENDLPISKMFVHPRTVVNSISVILSGAMASMLGPTLEPHVRTLGVAPDLVGVLFLVTATSYTVSAPIVGRVADKISDGRMLLILGFIVGSVGLLMVGPSPVFGFETHFYKLWLTVLSLVAIGLCNSMTIIPSYSVYNAILGDIGYPHDTKTYGIVSGLWISMFALGVVIFITWLVERKSHLTKVNVSGLTEEPCELKDRSQKLAASAE